jgi:hypothetical protein
MLIAALLAMAMQTTTTCIPLGGHVTCTSQTPQPYVPPPPITQVDVPGALRMYEAGRAQREMAGAMSEAPKGNGSMTAFQEELANRMGVLSRQGRCEDAFRLAALAGESELADASRELCPF